MTEILNIMFICLFVCLFLCRGATHSKAVICDKYGSIISKVTGPSTNHWQCGIPEVARRVAGMIESAKLQANISLDLKLESLGLSLSGCEQVRRVRSEKCHSIFISTVYLNDGFLTQTFFHLPNRMLQTRF